MFSVPGQTQPGGIDTGGSGWRSEVALIRLACSRTSSRVASMGGLVGAGCVSGTSTLGAGPGPLPAFATPTMTTRAHTATRTVEETMRRLLIRPSGTTHCVASPRSVTSSGHPKRVSRHIAAANEGAASGPKAKEPGHPLRRPQAQPTGRLQAGGHVHHRVWRGERARVRAGEPGPQRTPWKGRRPPRTDDNHDHLPVALGMSDLAQAAVDQGEQSLSEPRTQAKGPQVRPLVTMRTRAARRSPGCPPNWWWPCWPWRKSSGSRLRR